MLSQFSRTQLLLGSDSMKKLSQSHVAVFGIGGVGGFAVEALARSGIGELDLIDNDTVSLSNLNRQIIALHSTIGQYKVDAAAKRIYDICPETKVNIFKCFFMHEMRKRGVKDLKVIYSEEPPLHSEAFSEESHKPVPGSSAFVPSVAGLIIAGEVVKDLVK